MRIRWSEVWTLGLGLQTPPSHPTLYLARALAGRRCTSSKCLGSTGLTGALSVPPLVRSMCSAGCGGRRGGESGRTINDTGITAVCMLVLQGETIHLLPCLLQPCCSLVAAYRVKKAGKSRPSHHLRAVSCTVVLSYRYDCGHEGSPRDFLKNCSLRVVSSLPLSRAHLLQ